MGRPQPYWEDGPQQRSPAQEQGPTCDFCYAPQVYWDAQLKASHHNPYRGVTQWHFQICDSCRLLLRNVLGPVLHRVSHTELVGALIQLMAENGLKYDDLMQPIHELKAIESQSGQDHPAP